MTARTTIITVTHNSAAVIGTMLASVPPDTPCVVVDNDSTDGTLATLADADRATVLPAPGNVGFGRACNLGARHATTEFLLFLNPDAALMPGALPALEAEADARPDLGAANPAVEDGRGRVRLKMSSVLPVPALPRPPLEKAGQMPILSGGALFVRRGVFDDLGGFDENIFLYHEDHDLSWRIAQAGHTLWHLPAARARHIAGTGSARSPAMARWKGYHMARSRYYVLEKTRPGHGFRRTFLPACLALLAPINFLSARRRQKYLGQIAGALSAPKDGGVFDPK
ncbi:MAG: glycosyltransferase family 2 protein [Pseudomonadota bacterium]